MLLDNGLTPENISFCDSPVYWIAPACWKYSRETWAQAAAFHRPAAPPAVGAPAGTRPPADGDEAQRTVDEILARQMRDWQEQQRQEMEQQPYVPDAPVNWWLVGAVAAGAALLMIARKKNA